LRFRRTRLRQYSRRCCRIADERCSSVDPLQRMTGFLVYMQPPIPRCSSRAKSSLNSPSHFSLSRYGSRVDLRIVLFEDCSAFTRVAACTPALSPICDTLIKGFSHFVTSMTAPIASGWSVCRVGLAPTGKHRLCTAHVESRCGAVALGRTYLLPPLSFGGASMVPPWLRFHIPLIEPDRQISRIRLSDKTSRLRV
jgi:hypothetical protein